MMQLHSILLIFFIYGGHNASIYLSTECDYTNTAVICNEMKGPFLKSHTHYKQTSIYIVNSDISEISEDDFLKFSRVKMVSIIKCHFTFPKHQDLLNRINVTELAIEESNVTEKIKGVFNSNVYLTVLRLSGNKITNIKIDFLSNFRVMEEIYLDRNEISHIDVGAFDGLNSLKKINLEGNKIGQFFDQASLISRSSHCLICRETLGNNSCSQIDLIKCHNNRPWDCLAWVSFQIQIHVNLKNNPICNIIADDMFQENSQSLKSAPLSEWIDISSCEVDDTGSCFKHRSRNMILKEACDLRSDKNVLKDFAENNSKTTRDDDNFEHGENNVFPTISAVSTLIIFLLLLTGAGIGHGVTRYIDLRKITKTEKPDEEQGFINEKPDEEQALLKEKPDEEQRLIKEKPDEEQGLIKVTLKVNSKKKWKYFHYAALNGQLEKVQKAIKKGVDPREATKNEDTMLHLGSKGNHKEVVQYLLDLNLDANILNATEDTPLIIAARENHEKIVKVLIGNGADCSRANLYGVTALHCAAWHGNKEVVRMLLRKDVDINAPDKEGKTALYYATKENHAHVVELLLRENAQADDITSDGKSLLHIAAWNGNLQILELLLQYGAQVDVRDFNGYTPLHDAACKGHTNVLKRLLQCKSYKNAINAKDKKQGRTPLHQAAEGGHYEIIRELLAKGANYNAKNKLNKTPRDICREKGHMECEREFKKYFSR